MIRLRSSRRLLQFLAIAAAAPIVYAQETAPAAALADTEEVATQVIQVKGVRDPAMLPYETAFDMLTKIDKVSNGNMEMVIRVTSAHTGRPMPDLEVTLQGNTNTEMLALSPNGLLTVPLSRTRLDDKAVFLTNKKKGSLKVEYFFVPRLAAESFNFGDVAASIAAAQRARKEVVPWYLRLFIPAVKEVRFCYPGNREAITITGASTTTRPATAEQESMLTKETVYCAAVNEDEAAAAPRSIVTPAAGWTALFN